MASATDVLVGAATKASDHNAAKPTTEAISASTVIADAMTERVFLITTGASDITMTFPTAADNQDRVLTFIIVSKGAGNVVLDGEGAETIDGFSTLTMYTLLDKVKVIGNGTGWNTIEDGRKVPIISVNDDTAVPDDRLDYIYKVTQGSTDVTITYPTISANPSRMITAIKDDTGSGEVFLEPDTTDQTIEGSTRLDLSSEGNQAILVADANSTQWDIRDYYSNGTVADTTSDLDRAFYKYADGSMKQCGRHNPDTYDIGTAAGNIRQSDIFTITFGKTFTTLYCGSIVTKDSPSLWIGPEFNALGTARYRAMYGTSLVGRTEDYIWEASGTWR